VVNCREAISITLGAAFYNNKLNSIRRFGEEIKTNAAFAQRDVLLKGNVCHIVAYVNNEYLRRRNCEN
jgi:hypothetical protein